MQICKGRLWNNGHTRKEVYFCYIIQHILHTPAACHLITCSSEQIRVHSWQENIIQISKQLQMICVDLSELSPLLGRTSAPRYHQYQDTKKTKKETRTYPNKEPNRLGCNKWEEKLLIWEDKLRDLGSCFCHFAVYKSNPTNNTYIPIKLILSQMQIIFD